MVEETHGTPLANPLLRFNQVVLLFLGALPWLPWAGMSSWVSSAFMVLQKFIGSQGLGILEAWYFEGTMGDGAHFHVGVWHGALDPPTWDEAFLLVGIIIPSGILLPWIDSWPAWSWLLKFLPGQPQTHCNECS